MTENINNVKIPKVINYFWFGGNALPSSSIKYIKSWEKNCPQYKIKRWDETNFDLKSCRYAEEAYKKQKWAFVSDYARIYVLVQEGGIYLDTDVELIRSLDPIVKEGAFINLEKIANDKVAPGMSIIGAPAHNEFLEQILKVYKNRKFVKDDGTLDETPIGTFVSQILLRDKVKLGDNLTYAQGIKFYPTDYFSPINYNTGELNTTSNTYSIHHYSESWHTSSEKKANKLQQKINRRYGYHIGNLYKKSYRVLHEFRNNYIKMGLFKSVKYELETIKSKIKKSK